MARLEGTVVAAIEGASNSNLQLRPEQFPATNPFAAVDSTAINSIMQMPAQIAAVTNNAATSASMVEAVLKSCRLARPWLADAHPRLYLDTECVNPISN